MCGLTSESYEYAKEKASANKVDDQGKGKV